MILSFKSKAIQRDVTYSILSNRIAVALLSVSDVDVVHNIYDFIPRRPDLDWDEIAGYTMIYKTKHLQTYSGGPEGCYVYFV